MSRKDGPQANTSRPNADETHFRSPRDRNARKKSLEEVKPQKKKRCDTGQRERHHAISVESVLQRKRGCAASATSCACGCCYPKAASVVRMTFPSQNQIAVAESRSTSHLHELPSASNFTTGKSEIVDASLRNLRNNYGPKVDNMWVDSEECALARHVRGAFRKVGPRVGHLPPNPKSCRNQFPHCLRSQRARRISSGRSCS